MTREILSSSGLEKTYMGTNVPDVPVAVKFFKKRGSPRYRGGLKDRDYFDLHVTPELGRLINRTRESRCPECGCKGFRTVRRVEGILTFTCRKGHPHTIKGVD